MIPVSANIGVIPLSKEFDLTAVNLYSKLESCQRVAKRLGVSASTVHRALTRSGVSLPPRGDERLNMRKRKFDDKTAAMVADAYATGESIRSISSRFGAGSHAIYGAVNRFGVTRRPRGQQPRELSDVEKNEIVRLRREENLSQAVIAARIGCHQGAVSRHLRSCGIVSRPSSVGHGSWKGGRVKLGEYIGVLAEANWPHKSMINSSGYILEHRKVMAEHLGRSLLRSESVHHINGNSADNRIENLQLRQKQQHGNGACFFCVDCGSRNIKAREI